MAPVTNPKIEELRFKLKADPKSRLFYQLAEELRKNGQLDEAEKLLHTGLTYYPTYLAAWVSLGRVLRDQKNDGAAVEALNKAMQLDPGNVVAARILADAYLALGQKLEAVKKYKLVHALLPSDEELRNVIESLERELQPPAPIAVAPPEEESADEEPAPFARPVATPDVSAPNVSAPDEQLSPFAMAGETPPESAEPDDGYPAVVNYTPPPRAASGFAPYMTPESGASGAAAEDESPFDKTTPPFADAARSFDDEFRQEQVAAHVTGDVEPMSREHEESPFEDPPAGYSADALAIEAPAGMHIEAAPLAADVPSYLDEELPVVDSAPVFDTPAAVPPAQHDDVSSTVTMADLYVRQGLIDDARQIYESILARDPGNDDVRAKLFAITPQPEPTPATELPAAVAASGVDPRIDVLQRWLGKMTRREAGHV